MILAFDTYYYDNKAKTVGVSFNNWLDDTVLEIKEEIIEDVPDYEPGAFYKRELPCIISLLKQYNLEDVELIIVDSYVLLDDDGKLGLGGYLYNSLEQKIPVVGVAKSSFHLNKTNSKPLLRGDSIKPLYISAIGISLDKAYKLVKSMHGNYRMPTLLQILDTKTKER
ncbi:endonuclease V [Cellulophaga fucicola]|uniref:Endonuclease V n=1 Tax=Cellulophaga fucicola TaxID=76595 RepID=A0A1K1P376_9FLAO|nr:endonuclease V [Cellulophaga fucicola]SFW41961.1 Endonuclease V [Cellulophaga fucicola]